MMHDEVKLEKSNNDTNKMRIVLNLQNSKPVREAMDRVSSQLMEKNRKLDGRLAYK